MFQKLEAFTKTHAMLADKPNLALSSAELKAWWDSSPEEVREALNALIDALFSTTVGDSGAHNVGSATISGVPGSTVYAQIISLKQLIDNASQGAIPDGSLTPVKLSFDPVTEPELNQVKRMLSMGGMF